MKEKDPLSTRRDFLKTTTIAAAGSALAANLSLLSNVHAAGGDTIKVGLIGCGGRGGGAGHDVLNAAPNVEILALGDVFKDHLEDCRKKLVKASQSNRVKELGNKVDVPDERCFVGLDAYKKVIDSGVNYIILATPPGFRPIHLEAAVAAGKNIFTEKPVAVDGPGIRLVLDTYEKAQEKKLAIVAGTQRRHQLGYLETMKRIHDGAIGDIVAARAFWNQGILWKHPRRENMSDVQYQIYNWYNFVWLCGDHIVEQHVHNIDVVNWAIGAHPIKAIGMGSRTRTDPDYGHIYDFFAIDYEYPNGVHSMSMCRQIDKCADDVSEYLVGTKGKCHCNKYTINKERVLTIEEDRAAPSAYVQEHTDLIASIRAGKPLNELKQVAESTLTAIMGRMSAYTGKAVTWEKALGSELTLMPPKLEWTGDLPEAPVPIPGKTPLI